MNKTKIQNILNWIENADALELLGESPLLDSPDWIGEISLEDDPQHQILFFCWHDDLGQEYTVVFDQFGLDNARWDENTQSLIVADQDGNECNLRTYTMTPNNFTL